MKKYAVFTITVLAVVYITINFVNKNNTKTNPNINKTTALSNGQTTTVEKVSKVSTESGLTREKDNTSKKILVLKDVGEAYLEKFGLSDLDFKIISDSGFNIIEGNFDICSSDDDVSYFLNTSKKYGLKVIMPAGSGEAEWGYECNKEPYPVDQKPIWNKKAVQEWVIKWKNHPAVYAWDSSNEAGSVFPNSSPDKMLSVGQLKQAYRDIKEADIVHPVMIRMNGWFFYDYDNDFFRSGNPFDGGTADIVMINAYSNVEDYFPDFVTTVTTRSVSSIRKIDQKVKVVISLGIWEEKPIWFKPTISNLSHDISELDLREDIFGTAYFKYGAKGSEWYLPDSKSGAPELLDYVSKTNSKEK